MSSIQVNNEILNNWTPQLCIGCKLVGDDGYVSHSLGILAVWNDLVVSRSRYKGWSLLGGKL